MVRCCCLRLADLGHEQTFIRLSVSSETSPSVALVVVSDAVVPAALPALHHAENNALKCSLGKFISAKGASSLANHESRGQELRTI